MGCTDPTSISYDPDAEEDDGSCKYGGLGGNTTIIVEPRFHNLQITGKAGYPDSAFVKFNAIESPGINPADYDLVLAGDEGADHVNIDSMLPGNYFIFMTGWDTVANARLSGGVKLRLSQSSGSIQINVPVLE